MKHKTILVIAILGMILILSLSVISVSAKSTKTDFVAEQRLLPTGPPGRSWVSDDGILHIRDFTIAGPVWGDLNGKLTVVANINQDLTTENGTAYGIALLAVSWDDELSGTFEGRSQWKYTDGKVTEGQFVGHGTGDFEGMHMIANFYDGTNSTHLEGTIHNPHGE